MIVDNSELSILRRNFEESSIALRLGTYDVLHAGHKNGLDYAAAQADILVVGVMPDEYVTKVKGPERPLNSAENRVAAIDQAEQVDYSFIAPANVLGAVAILGTLMPDVYVESDDHAERFNLFRTGILKLINIQYEVNEHDPYNSSSLMIKRYGKDGALARSSLDFQNSEEAA